LGTQAEMDAIAERDVLMGIGSGDIEPEGILED
jgi:hypothetical protein